MKKEFLRIINLLFFIILINSAYSQSQNTVSKNYDLKMIMAEQVYNIDSKECGKAEVIARVLIKEFNFIASLNEQEKESEEFKSAVQNIKSALKSAELIDMNYSMFKEDIEYYKIDTPKKLNYENK